MICETCDGLTWPGSTARHWAEPTPPKTKRVGSSGRIAQRGEIKGALGCTGAYVRDENGADKEKGSMELGLFPYS